MEVTVEDRGGLERRMKVSIPEARVEGEVTSRLQSMARTVNMPGFRPGKVPVKVVMQRYGRQVRDEVVGEIVRSSFQDALLKENLRPAGSPTIDEVRAEPGNGVIYEAVFEVYPVVALPPMEAIRVVRPISEVSDADVDAMIETLRKQRRSWVEVDRAAERGDRLTIDFVGTCEGREMHKGRAEKVPIELGSGRMVEGFEAGLIGAKAGEDRTVKVTFPDDAPDESVAGKPAEFQVHVHAVQEPKLPEVDESFIESFGIAEGSLAAFRAEVRSNLARELDDAIRATIKRRVMDALLEKESLELPGGLVDEQVEQMVNQRRSELAYQGVAPDAVPLERSAFEPEARRRVALGLLLGEIVKQNQMVADPERVRRRIETIASTYDESDKVVGWYYGNPERLREIESAVLEDQVVEWILARADVTEQKSTFDELLNPRQTTEQDAVE